ncbi:LutC/YkgG family protein [Helicobacter turcicus]|uniref:Lactate utilization protein C n=1 Tax=Helicobacter turcicus TaxID=2867412 RepID=A0ABS7JNX4_9HELI|nr:lactate utilization protein C [Helicobacter turcicus]MBX7491109.1 lactate utilization protein C [Helicobacter turcicus]MBX7545973.1 lactate utilization protein C [Helicobacter turcicus]
MSRIQEISQRSKGQILERLKRAHKDSNFIHKPSIDPVEHIQRSGDVLEELKRKMIDNKYIVEECAKERLEEKINSIVADYGYTKMIYGESLGLDIDKIQAQEKVCFNKEIEELRQEVFHSEFSIVHARFGISSHGVALVHSSRAQPRMLSLAPTLCIMLLEKKNVVGSLAEALNLVKSENSVLPSNLLFIAGPSRTADIELITVFGVHGSQKVHLLLY